MSETAKKQFDEVRKGIDAVDTELVNLIAKRLQLTSEVGKLKAELKLPLYVPAREKELIQDKRQIAEEKGISADLIEDVLRRIIRESYTTQDTSRSQISVAQDKKIVVVGGNGQLGSLFVNLFIKSGYEVLILDKDDWHAKTKIFRNADLVLIAVPIRVTQNVIKTLSGLPKNCVLADITSIKEGPVSAMMDIHDGPVVGLHPMFGPSVNHLAKQTIVVCLARQNDKIKWLVEQLKDWGANLTFVTASEHDRLMSIIQVLRHFSTVAYGYHLKEENINLDKILELSSPIYRLELSMVGRLFAQDSELYTDIIFSSKKNVPMVKRFMQRMQVLLKMLESQDIESFSELFNDVSSWFGQNAEKFLHESNQLLAKANDIKK